MLVMSIDPGDTTGFILAQTRGEEILMADSAPIEEVYDLALRMNPESVILERQPQHSSLWASDTYDYYRNIMKHFSCVMIAPANWKLIARARKWKSAGDQHIKDAYNMYRFWRFTVGRVDIGDGTFWD